MATDLLISISRALELITLVMIVGCPTLAALFPKRKTDSLFCHDVL